MGALNFLSSCCNRADTKALFFNLDTVFAGTHEHGVVCKIMTFCSNLHSQSSLPFQDVVLSIDFICCWHMYAHALEATRNAMKCLSL